MSTAVANEPAPLAGGLIPLLDAGDIARIFGVERSTVLGWAKEGRLPKPVRIGRTVRWPRNIIEGLIETLAGTAD